jgi:3'(2'), 5'-bisphosphate nucleotidase
VTKTERQDAARFALAIARKAAALVAGLYEKELVVSYKDEKQDDPVTEADRAANTLISSALSAEYPGLPVVAEESDPATYAAYTSTKAAWFVDPLDGTRDFVKRNGEFAVMIGLAEEGRATLGVIVLPVTGRAFVGGVDVAAIEESASGTRKPNHVSSTDRLSVAEIVVSRSRHERGMEESAERFGVRKITPCGSAGVKGARVAAGEADVYLQPDRAGKLWDSCALEAIVVAAGGRVTDGRGRILDYLSPIIDHEHGLLVTNGKLHEAILAGLLLPSNSGGGREGRVHGEGGVDGQGG